MSESTVEALALAAHAKAEAERAAIREQREAERRARDDAEDRSTMEWVVNHPWIKRWLPDVRWVLVDRRFSQDTAVIHPADDSNLCLIVTRSNREYVLLASSSTPGQGWLVGADSCRTLADLGGYLSDRKRRLKETSE